ncbi:MAG: immunoglobulin domain-containing protein, partial [Bacteroidota bacterium]
MKKILIIIPVVFLFARFADAQNKAAGDERWDDQFITANAPDGIVRGIVSNGGNIYICGDFITAGGVSSAYVASWDGNSWSALGTGMNGTVYCLLYDSGLLYAGGNFSTAGGVAASNLAVWDGSNWQEFNGGTDGPVYAIAKQDMNIYVGGSFSTVDVTAASNIACWDGSAWNATGSGTNGTVYCIEPDGTTIYAGGDFTLAGGIAGTNYIAYWESSAWNAMSTGMDAVVRNILADAGSVYAAGDFTLSGGVTTNHIAKWNAGSWFALGTGTNGNIFSLQADGSDLYLGGSFTDANSVTASNICVYNGLDFNAMGSGTDNTVYALHISGYELFAGGNFLNAGGKQSEYIGRYMSPPVIITDPVNVIACIYDTVTFTVSAGGTEPLAYQWQLNGSDITGATGTSFTIYGVTPPDAGNYKCNVTNAAGTISSAQASLTVHLPPAVTVSPVNQEACLGDPVSMSVTASSTLPLTYQWQHEGTDITGAIFSTYNIASAAIPDTGQYLCIVENQCGDDTSDVAKLIVYPLPTVYFTGLDLNYCINDLPDTLHGVPSGGTFSGSGMTDSIFNPAGLLGLHTISYEYTDVHGCYNIYTKDFTGHTLPSVSMSGLDAEHCLNDNPDILTGTPAGGAFTGNGMTGNTLYPDIAGTGTHLITYTYTDTVGCTDTDTASTIIHEIPGIFIGNDTSICMGDSLTIYMSGDFGMYGWFFTTVINTSITVYPVSDTSYSGWIMNTYGCLGIDSIMVTVNP